MLLAHLPDSCADGLSADRFTVLWESTTRTVGSACMRLEGRAPADERQQQRLVVQLQKAVQRLPQALRMAVVRCRADAAAAEGLAGHQGGSTEGAVRTALATALASGFILAMLCELGRLPSFDCRGDASSHWAGSGGEGSSSGSGTADAPFGLQDIPAWCAAGAGMLRLLPPAADLLGIAEQQAECLPADLQGAPASLERTVLRATVDVAEACHRAARPHPAIGDVALIGAALEAIWPLHSAACRAAHWGQCRRAPARWCAASFWKCWWPAQALLSPCTRGNLLWHGKQGTNCLPTTLPIGGWGSGAASEQNAQCWCLSSCGCLIHSLTCHAAGHISVHLLFSCGGPACWPTSPHGP